MKVAIFKAKNKNIFLKIAENIKNSDETFIVIGKKVLRLPYTFEKAIAYSKMMEII